MATQAQCAARGMGYDGGVCFADKGGTRSWFDENGNPATAPFSASAGTVSQAPPPIMPDNYNPNYVAPPAPDFFSGISSFLTQPGLFGFPMWTNLLAVGVGLFVLTQMDSGGSKKKSSGGLF